MAARRRSPIYPFVPRTTVTLLPGQFWAIPLSDGTFACGRVIQSAPTGTRTMFLAGLLNWHGDVAPTSETIAGASCLAQGQAHLKTILETGGNILGQRPLELDGIEPWEFRGAHCHVNSDVCRGLLPTRPQLPTDDVLPILSTWGYHVPVAIAEKKWVGKLGPSCGGFGSSCGQEARCPLVCHPGGFRLARARWGWPDPRDAAVIVGSATDQRTTDPTTDN
jgi:hypothetical protein